MGYIKEKIIYHDKISIEQSTSITKPKNKLAGYCIQDELEVYLFFVLNSSNAALIKRFTVNYNNTEHISNKHKDFGTRYMLSELGYCDVTRFELLTHDTVIAKKRDMHNGFVKIGRLDNSKWEEIQSIINSFEFRRDAKGGANIKTLSELVAGVNGKEQAKSLLKQFRIA